MIIHVHCTYGVHVTSRYPVSGQYLFLPTQYKINPVLFHTQYRVTPVPTVYYINTYNIHTSSMLSNMYSVCTSVFEYVNIIGRGCMIKNIILISSKIMGFEFF